MCVYVIEGAGLYVYYINALSCWLDNLELSFTHHLLCIQRQSTHMEERQALIYYSIEG